MTKVICIGLMVLLILFSGCVQKVEQESQVQPVQNIINTTSQAIELCKELCLSTNLELENGPCLSDNNLNWTIAGWVCDIAHHPRIARDNLPENQCQDWLQGKANHFVELDTNCRLIRAL